MMSFATITYNTICGLMNNNLDTSKVPYELLLTINLATSSAVTTQVNTFMEMAPDEMQVHQEQHGALSIMLAHVKWDINASEHS